VSIFSTTRHKLLHQLSYQCQSSLSDIPYNVHIFRFHGKGAAGRKARSAARKVKNTAKKDARATKKTAKKARKEAGNNAGKKAKKAGRRAAKKGKKVGRKGKNCANACNRLTKNTGKTKISIDGCPCYMYEEEPLADFFDMYEEDEIDFIAEFLFDSYDEDSYDDEDESDSEDYYDDEEEDSAEDYYSYN